VPSRDATVVARLHAAGAVLVAKLTTGALAYGDIWDAGVTRNPWNPIEGSSGSSAGPAAAVAAGLVGFAIGTETLGSIVSPSMRCGAVGLRPTFGRVPRTGCMPLCWSLDKIGPITRRVDDGMRVLSVIAGADGIDPGTRDVALDYDASARVAGLRVGHVPAWFERDGNDADRSALAALRGLGVDLREVQVPEVDIDPLWTVLFAEAAATFERLVLDDRDDELDWQGADAWPNTFRAARFISAIDLVNADRVRRSVMNAFDRMFADVDAFVGPSFAGPMLVATNFTGHPCIVVRAGFVERAPEAGTDGTLPADPRPFTAPHGISLWGRLDDEGTLGRLAVALERALAVADRRPPGF
jgi:Asp-tRNA(Asn)/Glu-tRNA(Gln) amidotransferase A subunit family amidase